MAAHFHSFLLGLLYLICVVQVFIFVSFYFLHFREQAYLEREYGALQEKINFLKENCKTFSERSLETFMSSASSRDFMVETKKTKTFDEKCTRVTKHGQYFDKHDENTGPRGDIGDRGDSGQQGNPGLPGINGQKGHKGIDGSKGKHGIMGNKGQQGMIGDSGPKGFQGEKGDVGSVGMKGFAGSKGTPGEKGEKGERGDQGEKGVRGAEGRKGEPGITGDDGDRGPKGKQGQKGAKGAQGPVPVKPNCTCVLDGGTISGFPGDHISLNCSIMNVTSAQLTWLLDGHTLSAAHGIKINGHKLEIIATKNGTYICKAGQTEKVFHLNVIDFNCNFDKVNTCVWHVNDISKPIKWLEHSGGTSSIGTGPDGDHTTGRGHYIYIETSDGHANDYSSLLSPFVQLDRNACLTFYYNMHGFQTGKLEVRVENETGSDTVLWTKTGNQDIGWNRASVPLTQTSFRFRIALRAYKGSGYQGDIAVDDIVLNSGPCVKFSVACNFDKSLCGWTQATSDEFDWTTQRGPTSSIGTGPDTDHTTGKGNYMYIESSSPQRQGDTAELISPDLLINRPVCFSFWFSMHGVSMGSLSILAKQNHASSAKQVWIATGDHGNKWLHGEVTIPANTNNIIIEGAVGLTFTSDLAIDDVSASLGACRKPASP